MGDMSLFKVEKMAQNLLRPHFWLIRQTPTKNDQVKGIIKRKKERKKIKKNNNKKKDWVNQNSRKQNPYPKRSHLEMEV